MDKSSATEQARAAGLNLWEFRSRQLVPVVQGGMGVGVSAGGLAGTVASFDATTASILLLLAVSAFSTIASASAELYHEVYNSDDIGNIVYGDISVAVDVCGYAAVLRELIETSASEGR